MINVWCQFIFQAFRNCLLLKFTANVQNDEYNAEYFQVLLPFLFHQILLKRLDKYPILFDLWNFDLSNPSVQCISLYLLTLWWGGIFSNCRKFRMMTLWDFNWMTITNEWSISYESNHIITDSTIFMEDGQLPENFNRRHKIHHRKRHNWFNDFMDVVFIFLLRQQQFCASLK